MSHSEDEDNHSANAADSIHNDDFPAFAAAAAVAAVADDDDDDILFDVSEVPAYIFDSDVFREQVETFPQDTIDPLNSEAVKEWAIRRCAPWLDSDYEYDLVEYLGGEEAARAWIEDSLSTVTVPLNQVRMIALMEEAGYVFNHRNGIGRSSDDNDDVNVTAAAGGRDTSNSNTVGGSAGGTNNTDSSFEPSRPLRSKGQSPRKMGEQACKSAGTRTRNLLSRKFLTRKLITIENQRGDARKIPWTDMGQEDIYSIQMQVTNQTTILDVKNKVYDTWGVIHDQQFLWREIDSEALAYDDMDLLTSCGITSGRLLFLRHETRKGRLEVLNQAKLGSWWPLQLVAGWLCPLTLFHVPTVSMVGVDLHISPSTDAQHEDDYFRPFFFLKIVPKYHRSPPLEHLSISVRPLEFGSGEAANRDDDLFVFANSNKHRGYFVESVELELDSPLFVSESYGSITSEEEVQTRRGRTSSTSNSFMGRFGLGGEKVAEANIAAGRTSGKQESAAEDSTLSTHWSTATLQSCKWRLRREFWDFLQGRTVEEYSNCVRKSGDIPEVSTDYIRNLPGPTWTLPKSIRFLTLPSLAEVWNSDGGKQSREEKSKMKVKASMMLRKISIKTNRRAPECPEWHNSYRKVVMEGDIQLAVFPNTIHARAILLFILAIPCIILGALFFFSGKVWSVTCVAFDTFEL